MKDSVGLTTKTHLKAINANKSPPEPLIDVT